MKFKRQFYIRPFGTLYFDSATGYKPVSWGAAETLVGAKRGTLVRLGATEQYCRAIIYDRRNGTTLIRYSRGQGGSINRRDGD